jgi:hypothetical protein
MILGLFFVCTSTLSGRCTSLQYIPSHVDVAPSVVINLTLTWRSGNKLRAGFVSWLWMAQEPWCMDASEQLPCLTEGLCDCGWTTRFDEHCIVEMHAEAKIPGEGVSTWMHCQRNVTIWCVAWSHILSPKMYAVIARNIHSDIVWNSSYLSWISIMPSSFNLLMLWGHRYEY